MMPEDVVRRLFFLSMFELMVWVVMVWCFNRDFPGFTEVVLIVLEAEIMK